MHETDPGLVTGTQHYTFGHCSAIGARPTMEDTISIVGDFAGDGTQFFGLFDGHGGKEVADYCAKNLHIELGRAYQTGLQFKEAINRAIESVNQQIDDKWPDMGCTVAIAAIIDSKLFTANVGDTRILLIEGDSFKRLSVDHKASDPNEARLVVERGGLVFFNRVNGVLAITRAVGDSSMGEAVTSEPFVTENQIKKNMRLVIACDGVWDVLEDEEVTNIVKKSSSPENAAQSICKEALKRDTLDNVTVICVDLAKD